MKNQKGVTLVELTIAMGVATVALAATMLAFKDATNSNQMVALRQDITDNLRAGVNLLEQDLIQTGTGIPTGGIAIPNTGASDCSSPLTNIARPLLTGSTSFPHCNVVLPAIEPGADIGAFITSPDATGSVNTDVITMMYEDNSLTLDNNPIFLAPGATPGCAGKISAAADYATFDTRADTPCVPPSPSGSAINAGDLLMFSNTYGNALAYVTSVSWPTVYFAKNDPFGLNQTGLAAGTLKKLQNPDSSYPPTTVTRITMISYYLDNTTDPLHVRLIRRVNFNPGQPVGETLENLQFTYNFNDGVATNQPSVPNGYSESQIRSVNLYIGARSDARWAQTQKFFRTNFQTQVSLRSMAYFNSYK